MASLSDSAKHKPRVLITGARGFTGVYVSAELEAAGYQVIGSVIGTPNGAAEVELDLTSLIQCRAVIEQLRPDYVVHLAAVSFVQHENAEEFYRVNVIGTTNLLQAISDARLEPKRVLIASSANIYGNASGQLTESQLPQPVNHYAASKLAMEHMIAGWSDRLPIVVVRPFNYTGVGQDVRFLVPKIVSHFARRAPVIELGNLDIERDFSDVRMVANSYRRLIEKDTAGQVVNVCSGQGQSLRTVIDMLQKIAGYEIDVKVNQAFVRLSDVKTLVGAPQRLRELIGEPMAIPFFQTLEWMYGAEVFGKGVA